MPNLIRILNAVGSLLSMAGTAGSRRVWREIRWHQRTTIIAFAVMLVLPIIMYLAGMIFGWCGWIHGAKATLAAGAAVAALSSTLLWVRLLAYGYIAKLISEVLSAVSRVAGVNIPPVPRSDVDDFLVWARSWTAWYAIAGIMLAILPLWENLVASLLLFTALLGASAVITGKWSTGPWARRLAAFINLSILFFAVAMLINQRFVDAMWEYSDSVTDRWSQQAERETNLEEDRQEDQGNRDARDTKLANRFRKAVAALEQRTVDGCEGYSDADKTAGGPFCSKADRQAHRSLQGKVRQLEEGTYWNQRVKRSSRSKRSTTKAGGSGNAAKQPPVKGRAGSAAKLPPPPSLPGGTPALRRGNKRSSDRVRSSGGGGGVGPVPNVGGMDWDHILAPLPSRR